jgi:hypothetical protein
MTNDEYDADEGARPSSLRAVHKLSTPDRHYDLQLLRERDIINARTRSDLGSLPLGGVPAEAKRKPNLSAVPPIGHLRADETKEEDTMKLQHLAMAAAVTMTSGCHSVGLFHRHIASKVEDGILKIPFSNHVFDAACYDTSRCRVLYNNAYVVNQGSSRGPFTERDYDNMGGHWIILEPPGAARVTWTSKDGVDHDETIDLGEIFRSRLVRYASDLNVSDVNLSVPPSSPDIILVVENRSIRVYMKAWVSLLYPSDPTNKLSNFRTDPVEAYSRNF